MTNLGDVKTCYINFKGSENIEWVGDRFNVGYTGKITDEESLRKRLISQITRNVAMKNVAYEGRIEWLPDFKTEYLLGFAIGNSIEDALGEDYIANRYGNADAKPEHDVIRFDFAKESHY